MPRLRPVHRALRLVALAGGDPTGVLKDMAMDPVERAVPAPTDPQLDAALRRALAYAERLAARAAFVRWPPDGGVDLVLQNEPDVRVALASFPRLKELLAAPAGTR